MATKMKLQDLMPKGEGVSAPKAPGIKAPGMKGGGEGVKVHEIHEHPDGHLETHMHDGTHTEHPDHLHALAHIGHHISGGDAHHIAHHDGFAFRGHGITPEGEHGETHDHDNLEDLKSSMDEFLAEEGKEKAPESEDDGRGNEDESYSGF